MPCPLPGMIPAAQAHILFPPKEEHIIRHQPVVVGVSLLGVPFGAGETLGDEEGYEGVGDHEENERRQQPPPDLGLLK